MQFTLNYWSKVNGQRIERVYVNRVDADESLGYWERRTSEMPRTPFNYYDRHRLAKGDDVTYVRHDTTFRQTGSYAEADLLAAIGVDATAIQKADSDCGGSLFGAIATRARNGHPNWYGNTPVKEKARLKRERDNAVFTIA